MTRVLLLPLLFLAACAFAQTSPLNDTGQTLCFDQDAFALDPNDALQPCIAANTGDGALQPRQDGRFGRDAQAGAGALTKVGAGAVGFDFTKIANNGSELPVSATLGSGPTDWACTRDNVTGLIWEVKTPLNAGQEFGFLDDANEYAAGVNANALCGFSDWRVPARRELLSIVHHGVSDPSIDTTFFPNTAIVRDFPSPQLLDLYYSREALNSLCFWSVRFGIGNSVIFCQNPANVISPNVRLVRSDS